MSEPSQMTPYKFIFSTSHYLRVFILLFLREKKVIEQNEKDLIDPYSNLNVDSFQLGSFM